MSPFATIGAVLGALVVLVAAVGLIRFGSPYARIHAAGKASPVAFVIVAVGAAPDVGWSGALRLVLAAGALVLTLPVAVHLLFRAVHASSPEYDPPVDELQR